jgi:hypothetical protein
MRTDIYPEITESVDTAPEPTERPGPQVLIPEVRQHARRRRLRNLALVLIGAGVAAGLFVSVGSGPPAAGQASGPSSPSASGSTRTEHRTVALRQPDALAVGPTGALYVADDERQQILVRLPSGRFRVIAGTGVGGYSGDGGPATRAKVQSPIGLAVSGTGVVYFSQQARVRVPDTIPGQFTYIIVVREIARDGRISTIIGQDPNCHAVPAGADYIPARSALVGGGELTIGLNGFLDLRTRTCPGAPHVGGYVQMTPSGRLVQTPADSVPNGSEFCGGGVTGRRFAVFSCGSGDRRGPRLMVVRFDGRIHTYRDVGSQAGYMTEAAGSVVANYNRAIVRITASGIQTLATQRQIAGLVPGAIGVMGGGGGDVAVSRTGTVYAVESVLAHPHGCTSVIAQITPRGTVSAAWLSAQNQTCF